jgi:heme-degrading monooxygenase HmoA
MDRLKGWPGLLGTRVMASLDQSGQVVIVTWWKDKAAVNDWFYGEAHQGMIRDAYGTPAGARSTDVTQVGIELFAPLPGGTRIHGGLTPESAGNR